MGVSQTKVRAVLRTEATVKYSGESGPSMRMFCRFLPASVFLTRMFPAQTRAPALMSALRPAAWSLSLRAGRPRSWAASQRWRSSSPGSSAGCSWSSSARARRRGRGRSAQRTASLKRTTERSSARATWAVLTRWRRPGERSASRRGARPRTAERSAASPGLGTRAGNLLARRKETRSRAFGEGETRTARGLSVARRFLRERASQRPSRPWSRARRQEGTTSTRRRSQT
mmetsp:Transcript_15363/g.48108  ORF Transcript_15363/g.48108 Transcript_15363/m.48108 type:complete len:229 (+) Transcript_15363:109-795(+)